MCIEQSATIPREVINSSNSLHERFFTREDVTTLYVRQVNKNNGQMVCPDIASIFSHFLMIREMLYPVSHNTQKEDNQLAYYT